ncbi:MAG: PEP-CTERM sorting domain-containing protein [Verrucomicrobia bacterium]|nr:PEP-CTERM sorting domain-containing protein [Verrucomicrobiota bacterium]
MTTRMGHAGMGSHRHSGSGQPLQCHDGRRADLNNPAPTERICHKKNHDRKQEDASHSIREGLLSKFAGRASLVIAILALSFAFVDRVEAGNYSVTDATGSGGALEHRFMYDASGQHFMTLIEDNGAIALRPHPGTDHNGWGSTLYLEPFLPGAVLGHTTVDSVVAGANDIEVIAHGAVSRGSSSTYGNWSSDIRYLFNPTTRRASGTGTYSITLDGPIDASTGDLNLFKIASNYLDNVPRLSGGTGDTGDMKDAIAQGDTFLFTWIPPNQPGFFPSDTTDTLSINVEGQFNDVDTAAQGYSPIAAAYKPSLEVSLSGAGSQMTFGAFYDTAQSQYFWADNVGITPLIRQGTPGTSFNFTVAFGSSDTQPTPEPATGALLIVGGMFLLARRRKSKVRL